MRLRRLFLLAGFSCLLVLTGCAKPKSFDSVSIRPRGKTVMPARTQEFVNTASAADMALLARNRAVFAWVAAGVRAEEQPPRQAEPPTVAPDVTVPAATPSSVDWPCVAEAETGSDYSMHGSTYSTAFGMVNDIIYEYGTPAEQAAVFSGTASKETQIRIASAFAADHGFGGWGELTKQKCGL